MGIVNVTEVAPDGAGEARSKFLARRDRALATIVVDRPFLVVPYWCRPRGSCVCVEEAEGPLPEENVG